jgi:hypothetical protein
MISDRLVYALAHPLQRRRFHLALVFSIILFPVVVIGLAIGTFVLVVPIFALFFWISSRVLLVHSFANSVLVSDVNYPRINLLTAELKVRMGYEKPIYIFVSEKGYFNAGLRFFFFRSAIFLNSELLETGVSDNEVRWLVGRFIGYLRTRRMAGVLGWIIRAAQHLGIFNIFLLPYERAMVYTGDRIAVAAIGGDISSAISAMQKLLVGRQLGYSLNPEGIIEQQRRVKGSFFAFLARLMSAFPHMTSRYVDLIVFAKVFFPAQFAQFAAANPGLPGEISRLVALPQLKNASHDNPLKAAAKPPHGWIWALGTAAVIAFGISALSYPELNESGLAKGAITAGVAPGANPLPGDLRSDIDGSKTNLPPHVHRDTDGELSPDDGCKWLNDTDGDFRVVCD